jgi:hypothetical protein
MATPGSESWWDKDMKCLEAGGGLNIENGNRKVIGVGVV